MAFEFKLYINLCLDNITKTLCKRFEDSKNGRLQQKVSVKNFYVKFLWV